MTPDSLCSLLPKGYTGCFFHTEVRQIVPLGKNKGIMMARVCQYCGKRTQMGNSVKTRGKPKYLGGVGTKITGITRRKFKPNLQRVKVVIEDGSTMSVRVCTQCLRSGVLDRTVKRRAFELNS